MVRRITVSVALSLALTLAVAAHAAEPYLGAWDVTLSRTGFEDTWPCWFQIDQLPGVGLTMTFQRPDNAPVAVRGIEVSDDQIAFQVPGMGAFTGNRDGGEYRGIMVAFTPDTAHRVMLDWRAVRAPALDAPEKLAWGDPVKLFDGVSLAGWTGRRGGTGAWAADSGMLVNREYSGDLMTVQRFTNFKLHLQYRLQPGEDSGLHLRGRYEIQITDRPDPAGSLGASGAVYGFLPPASRAEKPAGEWNTLDAELVGRTLTATLNGVRIHDHVRVPGITGDAIDANEAEPGPIVLQGYLGRVAFRDLVITPAR